MSFQRSDRARLENEMPRGNPPFLALRRVEDLTDPLDQHAAGRAVGGSNPLDMDFFVETTLGHVPVEELFIVMPIGSELAHRGEFLGAFEQQKELVAGVDEGRGQSQIECHDESRTSRPSGSKAEPNSRFDRRQLLGIEGKVISSFGSSAAASPRIARSAS
ncbi:MAG: hypothetical protein WDO24_03270 [Pseudomonadota bacterium]